MSSPPRLLAALTGLWMAVTTATAATIDVDCTGRSTEPPLSKSLLGVYQTPFWFKTHPPTSPAAARLVARLTEAGVHDLRYELAWGKPDGFAPDMVAADAAGRPRLDPAPLAPFLHALADAHVRPLLSLTYCPTPLQHGPAGWQRWKAIPSDLAAFGTVCHAAAADWAFARPAFEVWNEPDLPGDGGKAFFAGDPAAYGRLFAAAATAVRPAAVGGPAIAYDTAYLSTSGILDRPIDFVSVHAYANARTQLAAARAAMGSRVRPLWLTEYASYAGAALPGSSAEPAAAAAFFADVKLLLAEPGLAKVYWAQWADDSIGLLDDDLHRRPLFHALAAYQTLLPTTRRPTRVAGPIDAMAAAEDDRAAVVVWSMADRSTSITVRFDHPPAGARRMTVMRLDANHGNGDPPPTSESSILPRPAIWSSDLPARGVVMIQLDP